MSAKILIVDDDLDVLTSARIFLKRNNYQVHTESNPERIPFLLSDLNPDVILLDMNYKMDITSGKEGLDWLSKILKIKPNQVVVMITGYGDVELAVRSIRAGANDFILKPWQNEKLLATMNSAVNLSNTEKKLIEVKEQRRDLIEDLNFSTHSLIGESEAFSELKKQIKKVANTDANILILGENGTGKELVARALHNLSNRNTEPFIAVDLGLIQENLFESELFGHVRGAFTDAQKDKTGKVELADGGTLFFDEVGNLPLNLQPKLLRTLEQRQIEKLGSNQVRNIDIRLISATNSNIYQLSENNEFRKDLLYRLNTIEIVIPPLRERGEDILLIADYYLNKYSKKYNKDVEFTDNFKKELMSYNWPGNVRELKHFIERSIIMTDNNLIEKINFAGNQSNSADVEINGTLEEIERKVIEKVMTKHQGNVTKAAKQLGLTRTSLYRRLEKFGI